MNKVNVLTLLQRIGGNKHHANNKWLADNTTLGLDVVKDYLKSTDSKADLFTFLCHDQNYNGVIGLAWVGIACHTASNADEYLANMNEWRKDIASNAYVSLNCVTIVYLK